MPYISGPSERVKELVARKNGNIWTGTTLRAAGGAALARAVVEMHVVPDKAKTLLGWRPIDHGMISAVAESTLAVFDIQGANYNFQPQEVICGNTAGSLLASGSSLQANSEYYDVFAPVAGGEVINVGVEPCDALGAGRRSAVEFTWTDVRLPELPVIRSLCSREIAIAIAAVGEVPGLAMPITDAHELVEVGGCATESINTAGEELMVNLILRCTALPINEIRCCFEPYGATDITPGSSHAYVSRRMQRMKFSQSSVTITSAFDVDIALAAAGQAVHFIRWT
jgi:hypothetical protein